MDRAEPVVSDFGVKKTVGAWSTAPGGDHTCFVGLNGKIGCWGWNDQGQLGDGTQNNSATPVVAKF
jgi:alpha-tubulin suppressor-like RCC1 family protein